MDLPRSNDGGARFSDYVEGLTGVIGHADRVKPLRDYCLGLMMPCERKSVEPMAAITAPERTAAQHQSLLHFISEGRWSDEKVLAKVRELVLPEIERRGPIEAWIIDDTSFPKKGQHSVGVARQYCGQLGKQDNCQVAVTLSVANHDASLPVAYRLYLPRDWASDRKRRCNVGVPDEIRFKTKLEIALAQICWACEAGLTRGVVLMDAGYGVDTNLRTNITTLGLSYVAGISHIRRFGARDGPAAAKEMVGPRATPEADASRQQAQTCLGQGACTGPAKACLAHDHMAGSHGAGVVLAICPCARSRRASGLLARRQSAGGAAAD